MDSVQFDVGEVTRLLQSARAGQRLFHVSGSDVRAPFGVEVVQVAPANVYMTFEKSATKVVPIVPEVEGEPAAPGDVAAHEE